MATEYLTAKQVQDLLKVDRTTVYRMLKDGRLTGVRIGQQWRFPLENVQTLLGKEKKVPVVPALPANVLPVHCVQVIQDVFADIAQVASVTASPEGEAITEMSGCSRFCTMIRSSAGGKEACAESWKKLAASGGNRKGFAQCHAGLNFVRGEIRIGGEEKAILVACQFHADEPDAGEREERAERLAEKFGINWELLAGALREIPLLDRHRREQTAVWLDKVARTFEQISSERADLMSRLRDIASLTGIQTTQTIEEVKH